MGRAPGDYFYVKPKIYPMFKLSSINLSNDRVVNISSVAPKFDRGGEGLKKCIGLEISVVLRPSVFS